MPERAPIDLEKYARVTPALPSYTDLQTRRHKSRGPRDDEMHAHAIITYVAASCFLFFALFRYYYIVLLKYFAAYARHT